MKRIIYVLITALLFASGCSQQAKKYLPFSGSSGDESQAFTLTGGTASNPLVEIRVNPANAQIAKNTYGVFQAEGVYANGSHHDITSEVTWTTANATISEATTTNGRVSGKGAGDTQVTATLASINGAANLKVTNATLVSVGVSTTSTRPQVALNTSTQYIATAVFSDGTTQDITSYATWTTGSSTIATVVSNDPITAGQVTGVGAGNTTVAASFTPPSGTPVSSNERPLTVTTATLVSITISGNSDPTLGTVTPLTATGTFSDGTTQDLTTQVTWATADPNVATQNNSVETGTKGFLTAVSSGSTAVTATLGSVAGTANVAIAAPKTVTSIAITAAVSVINGLTYQYTATATYSDNTTKDVTLMAVWNSASTGIATVATSLENGGTLQSISIGEATITATFGGVTSNPSTVTVNAPTLVSIAVTPNNSPSVIVGLTQAFTAMGTYDNSSTADITSSVVWSSSNITIADISNAADSTKGKATGWVAGSTNITATLGAITSNTVPLAVSAATLVSIAVTPNNNPSVIAGLTKAFTATGTYNNQTTVNITSVVTWNSSATGVATISNVADATKGVATGVGAGSTNITATLGAVTSTPVALAVSAPSLVSIAVTPNNPSIIAGSTQAFTATGTYNNSTKADVTSSVTWNSSATGVATISNVADATKGVATGVGAGSTNITANLGAITSTPVALGVSAAVLVSIAVTPNSSPSVNAGSTLAFTATGTYNNSTTADITSSVTWSSSALGVATISNVAGATKGVATGVSAGSTNITATLGAVTSNIVALTGTAAALVSIAVTPNNNPSIISGLTQAFTATGTYSNSTTANITSSVTWNSSATGVATISNVADATKGVATGVGAGSTNITATKDTITSNSAALGVTAATISSIAITPSVQTTVAGTTIATGYIATATYNNGSTANISSLVTWNSSATGVATISNAADASNGKVTGVSAGSANITATYSGVTSNTIPFTVNATVLASISINAPTSSVVVGLTTNAFTATGHYDNGSTADISSSVTWNTSAPGNATISNVAGVNKGKATGVVAGSTNITATLGAVTSSSVALSVVAKTLVSIAITPASPSNVIVGTTQSTGFTATGTYNDSTTANITSSVTWNTSASGVASISNVADATKGKVTGVSAGSANISATDPTTSISSGTVSITIDNATLLSITVTGDTNVSYGAQTAAYVAMGHYNDGLADRDISGSVTWSSSDTAKATISGATKKATGIYAGTTSIKATSGAIDSNLITLTVQAVLANVTVTPSTPSVTVGGTQQFTATANYNGGASSDITNTATWTSSNTGFATITTGGLASGVGAGSPTITATFSGMSGTATLTVNAGVTLSSISVSPNGISVPSGFSQQFTATGTYSNNTTADITNTVTWASSSTGVATISNADGSRGLASALSAGTTNITATLGAISNSKTLTVNSLTVSSIYIGRDAYIPLYSDEPTNSNKSSKYYTAIATLTGGSQLDVTDVATWASSSTSAVTISNVSPNKGKALAVATGTSTITATFGGKTGTANLTVNATNYNSVTSTFTSSVYSNVPVNMNVKSSDNIAVSGVTVRIFSAQDVNSDILFQGISNGAGNISGTVGITISSNSVTVYAQAYKGGYTSAWYPIEVVKDVSGTISIILQFGDLVINNTAATLNGITITDTDGDGVEDSLDAAPSDPQIAFKQRYPGKNNGKVYTQAFERDWPKYSTTSTDLNDYVVQYYYEEYLNASGKITKILGNYEVITAIWNTTHLAGLKLRLPSSANVSLFKSERYTYKNVAKDTVTNLTNLTASNLKDDLFIFPQRNLNTIAGCPSDVLCVTGIYGDKPFENPYYGNDGAAHGAYYPGDISRVTIQFGAPISRDELGSAPYDVFLFYADGSHYALPATKEIHRVGLGYLWSAADPIPTTALATGKVQADYNGKDKYLDEWAVFQWAILVPQVWKPGHEQTVINNIADTGYIKYANWVSTKGQQNADWYRDTANMVQDKIYQIQPLPNKHLCLDCTVGTESYDPDTLPTVYENTANVAFLDQVADQGSQFMAYIAKTAKSNTARGAAAAIALLVGAILAGRVWFNRKHLSPKA